MATPPESIDGQRFTIDERIYLSLEGAELRAIVYRPSGAGPFPALVDVHGGAWVGGGPQNDSDICQALASAGAVIASIEFRVPPVARYPGVVADVNIAIRWLKANAVELDVDLARVGGIGHSSGGHLLMLAGMRPFDTRYCAHVLEGHEVLDASLRFAVLAYPIVDPVARYRMAKARNAENLVRGHEAFWTDVAEMAEGSPQAMLERGEPVDLPDILVVQGDADQNVTDDMAERFVDAYRRSGGAAALARYADAGHGFLGDRLNPAFAPALEAIRAFVSRVR